RRHTRVSRDWSSDVCSSDLSTATPSAAIALSVPVIPFSSYRPCNDAVSRHLPSAYPDHAGIQRLRLHREGAEILRHDEGSRSHEIGKRRAGKGGKMRKKR